MRRMPLGTKPRRADRSRVREAAALIWVGLPGPVLDAESRSLLATFPPGGIVLFGRNVSGPLENLQRLTRELSRLVPDAILSLDAEGGRVDRLRNLFGKAPGATALARHPVLWSRRAGQWIGASLRLAGVDLDLAPVVDLDHGIQGNALDGRCLGNTPRSVLARGRAFLEGLRAAGVGGCLKHYPGLGAAPADTHFQATRIDLSISRLRREEESFRILLADGEAPAVLVGHAVYPAMDREQLPASISPFWIGRLRKTLRFPGVVICDDLEMGALAAWGDLPELAVRALQAGADALPICSRLDRLPDLAAALARHASGTRVGAASRRQQRLRRYLVRLAREAPDPPLLETIRAELERLGESTPAAERRR